MSAPLQSAQRLRQLAQRVGEKVTRKDAAMLIQAAAIIEVTDHKLSQSIRVYGDMLSQEVDSKFRLLALQDTVQAALELSKEGE
jgi:hypothetical protein